MQIVYKALDELKLYGRNPRKNDEAARQVAKSIEKYGFRVPVLIDGSGTVICGHTRVKAARLLGMEKIPCIEADDMTEEQGFQSTLPARGATLGKNIKIHLTIFQSTLPARGATSTK